MAEAIRRILPNVLEGLKVFLSCEDIRKGGDWLRVIRDELESTDSGYSVPHTRGTQLLLVVVGLSGYGPH